ncbi:MAG: hypothetical protein ACRDYA_05450 [Egibacteraceae bacterium]
MAALRRILLRTIKILFLVVLGFIGFSVLFQLLDANPANEIVAFVERGADWLLTPFEDMFEGQNFLLTALIAVLAYALAAAVASAIVRMLPARPAGRRVNPPPDQTPRRRWTPRRSVRAGDRQ